MKTWDWVIGPACLSGCCPPLYSVQMRGRRRGAGNLGLLLRRFFLSKHKLICEGLTVHSWGCIIHDNWIYIFCFFLHGYGGLICHILHHRTNKNQCWALYYLMLFLFPSNTQKKVVLRSHIKPQLCSSLELKAGALVWISLCNQWLHTAGENCLLPAVVMLLLSMCLEI